MNRADKSFYDRQYSAGSYAKARTPEEHSSYIDLRRFVDDHDLVNKRCLEIGAGRGAFQDLVPDYTATDVSDVVRRYFHKPFFQASATQLPFQDDSFHAIWSVAALEHIPEPEKALSEMRRVLKHKGLIYLAPAWQCRPWAAQGYPVRSYKEFDLKGKLVKASVFVRDSVAYRSLFIFPQRLLHLASHGLARKPTTLRYRELTPNYEHFWMPDSDAVNSIDPFEAILWFCSRGDECPSHPDLLSQFFVRTGALIVRICKNQYK